MTFSDTIAMLIFEITIKLQTLNWLGSDKLNGFERKVEA
jgi:hypothetical protein